MITMSVINKMVEQFKGTFPGAFILSYRTRVHSSVLFLQPTSDQIPVR
jgi:hypothetical protein